MDHLEDAALEALVLRDNRTMRLAADSDRRRVEELRELRAVLHPAVRTQEE